MEIAVRETNEGEGFFFFFTHQISDFLAVSKSALSLCIYSTLQTDLEESKKQENAKYEASLEEIQNKFKETEALLIKERETAKEVSEVLPIIKEVPVVDQELMEKLTNENETLKVTLSMNYPPNKNILAKNVDLLYI